MNTSHYPSLELCKKLTEIGFPRTTEKVMVYKQLREDYGSQIEDRNGQHTNGSESRIVCPSVMEMLDVMPRIKIDGYSYGPHIGITQSRKYVVGYAINDKNRISDSFKSGTLPNALAEMILWLYENNYISFTK